MDSVLSHAGLSPEEREAGDGEFLWKGFANAEDNDSSNRIGNNGSDDGNLVRLPIDATTQMAGSIGLGERIEAW